MPVYCLTLRDKLSKKKISIIVIFSFFLALVKMKCAIPGTGISFPCSIKKNKTSFPSIILYRNHFRANFPHSQFIGQCLMNGCMSQNYLSFWPSTKDQNAQSPEFWHFDGRFIFNRVSAFWECPKPPEKLSPCQNTVSINLSFWKKLHHSVPKSEAKLDSAPLLEIIITH